MVLTAYVSRSVQNTGKIQRPAELLCRKVSLPGLDTETIFRSVFGDSTLGAFWLDGGSTHGRFSFIGDATGPLGHVLEYTTTAKDTAVPHETVLRVRRGIGPSEAVETHHGQSVLAYLKSEVSPSKFVFMVV